MPLKEVEPIGVQVDRPSTVNDQNDPLMQIGQFGDGRIKKMEVDYTNQVNEQIPKANLLAMEGKVQEAVESLQQLEKKSRLDCDMKSNMRVTRHMVKLPFDAKKWDLLNDTIKSLCKKRALIKMSIKSMIQDCCEMIDQTPSEVVKNGLIDTLRAVTAGKIYVEVERARLTKRVADNLVTEGKLDEARDMIMDLQVETYGSMEVNEKVTFLLYQMRLSIMKEDFTRANIISRKISKRFFERPGEEIELMKLEYYKYMVQIGLQDEAYLDVSKHFMAIMKTPRIQEDEPKQLEILKCVVLYLLLSPYDNEKYELLHRTNEMRELERLPAHKALLELFIRQELIFWQQTIEGEYAKILFKEQSSKAVLEDQLLPSTRVFPMNTVEGQKRKERLHDCVGEHNVRMIAKYYTRISFQRMAALLEFNVEQMETFVCKLIVDGVISDAKIHRPSQIIYLRSKESSIEILDQWGSNVRKLTDIMNKVTHLIVKEEMVHGMQISQRA